MPHSPSARLCRQEQRAVISRVRRTTERGTRQKEMRANCRSVKGSVRRQQQQAETLAAKREFKGRDCMNASGTRMLFYITRSQAAFLKRVRHNIDSHPT